MIKIVEGDILDATEELVCHQVNCQGIMGGGLVLQIKRKYPLAYKEYLDICWSGKKRELLGDVCFTTVGVLPTKVIASIFGQFDFGEGLQTDYKSLEKGFLRVLQYSNMWGGWGGLSVCAPYSIGCGLAGGDWNIVYGIIERVFSKHDITPYRLPE